MSESSLPTALQSLINEIHLAIKCELYYSALTVALTLPEICSALSFTKDKFVKQVHYVAFVNKYTTPPNLGFNGAECYQLRGGIIHRGNAAGGAYHKQTNVGICLGKGRDSMHALSYIREDRSIAFIRLDRFVGEMILGVERWFEDHREDATVAAHSAELVRKWNGDEFGHDLKLGEVMFSGPDWPF